MAKIGLITIGQSPREDVVSEMMPLLGPGIGIVERGALDGLSRAEIMALKPEAEDFSLITRLQNGSSTVVGQSKIVLLLQRQVDTLEESGIGLMALLCTGDFPEVSSRGLLLRPCRILFQMVRSLLDRGTLGIFVPLEDQVKKMRKKWEAPGLEVVVKAANPYGDSAGLEVALKEMKREKADLIVLDCIGYGLDFKNRIRQVWGKPVLLPRTVLARAIRELTGE